MLHANRIFDALVIGTGVVAAALAAAGLLPLWAPAAALPLGLILLAKSRQAAELDRLRAIHKAYSLRQMMLTERRRVW